MAKRFLHVSLGILLLAGPALAQDPFVGMDRNQDTLCDPPVDMAYWATEGEDGSVSAFFTNMPGPLFMFGCVFCVKEKSMIESESWVYNSPDGWTDDPMLNTEDDPGAVPVSDWIPTMYPNYKCWLIVSTDFTLSNPMVMPDYLGTFSYTVAESGCLGFIVDGPNCGYFTTGFAGGSFYGEGMYCPPAECEPTRTESEAWGRIKGMFR